MLTTDTDDLRRVRFCSRDIPWSRTPPFFLKRGLPDHSGGLGEGDKEIKETLVNHLMELRQTGRSGGLRGEAGSETGI